MKVVYEFLADAPYYEAAWLHWRKQRSMLPVLLLIKWTGGLVLTACAVALLVQHYWIGAVACTAFCAIIVMSTRIDCWLLARRIRRSPSFGESVTATLSSEGCHGLTPTSEGWTGWPGFIGAVEFPDGLLILSGPGMFRWFPDAAIVEGTAYEARAIVRRHMQDVRTVD